MRQYQYFYPRTQVLEKPARRILLASDEIKEIEPTPAGAVITLKTGLQFKVTSPKPNETVIAHRETNPEVKP